MTYDEYDDYTGKRQPAYYVHILQQTYERENFEIGFLLFYTCTGLADVYVYDATVGCKPRFETNHTTMMDELTNAANKSVPKNLINFLFGILYRRERKRRGKKSSSYERHL